ncbi:predicted protein [Plenodomus lingam JN3]|uniref:Predicted protein n=1 Tax=Leptosphaeria maculans (strain JN3 / isolate v23.1.3 / race Av1-4-5-6-7-8) TaxID=985895 RepID=E4ZJ60_LEPMJ|nr:predicted protein [Plenodomus lingam JN3]CBX91491.1 predicted protein [Plenodomus lingam JN3]
MHLPFPALAVLNKGELGARVPIPVWYPYGGCFKFQNRLCMNLQSPVFQAP